MKLAVGTWSSNQRHNTIHLIPQVLDPAVPNIHTAVMGIRFWLGKLCFFKIENHFHFIISTQVFLTSGWRALPRFFLLIKIMQYLFWLYYYFIMHPSTSFYKQFYAHISKLNVGGEEQQGDPFRVTLRRRRRGTQPGRLLPGQLDHTKRESAPMHRAFYKILGDPPIRIFYSQPARSQFRE